MLTDRQLIAMHLLANTINNEADLVFVARGDKGTRKMINYALNLADTFLEVSNPSSDEPSEIIKKFQKNNQKLQEINESLNAQYSESDFGN